MGGRSPSASAAAAPLPAAGRREAREVARRGRGRRQPADARGRVRRLLLLDAGAEAADLARRVLGRLGVREPADELDDEVDVHDRVVERRERARHRVLVGGVAQPQLVVAALAVGGVLVGRRREAVAAAAAAATVAAAVAAAAAAAAAALVPAAVAAAGGTAGRAVGARLASSSSGLARGGRRGDVVWLRAVAPHAAAAAHRPVKRLARPVAVGADRVARDLQRLLQKKVVTG